MGTEKRTVGNWALWLPVALLLAAIVLVGLRLQDMSDRLEALESVIYVGEAPDEGEEIVDG